MVTTISVNEREFVLDALKSGLRTDTRGMLDSRRVRIMYGQDLGMVEVLLGSTRVTATVSAEITKPRDERGSEGVLMFNTELLPMSSPDIEQGKTNEDEVMVSRMLDKSLRRSMAVDTEGLCIVAGEKIWTVRVDVRVLDNDGNIMDCASIAAAAALLHFRRPDVTVVDRDVVVHTMEEKNPVPLTIYHVPLCISFAFFHNGNVTLVDPALVEDQLKDGSMTIAMNIHREVCSMSMSGGSPLETDQVLRCTQTAAQKVNETMDIIQAALSKDYEKRGISLHASNIFEKIKSKSSS
ncbi:3'-5'-exoribonuclease [Sorochytrium milnesiophthora]